MTTFSRRTSILNFTIIIFHPSLMSSYNFLTANMTSHENKISHLRIYFVTWNVATKDPEQDLHALLNLTKRNDTEQKLPDMYIIGLQEVKSQVQNMVANMFFYDPWTQAFRETLKKYDYVKIHTMKMMGLVINAFSLRKHVPHLRFIEAEYTKTGFNGFLGNKGAVSIRMNFYGINVCFINTHLPPHDYALQNRIDDYETIMKNHIFKNSETNHILFHDYIFWIGDLNFRLNEGISAADIALLVRNDNLETLLEKDQLMTVKNKGLAFSEFTEEKITFPPTYKYEFASQEFDLKRRPSWTDRILYKVNADSYGDNSLKLTQHNYKSYPSYVQSDHKPVTAEFDMIIRPNCVNEHVELLVPTWFLDKENTVTYRYLGGYKPDESDYIGLFHEHFDSIEDYILYEYVKATHADTEQLNENRLYFGLDAARSPGVYRLVYFSQKQSALSILGISCAFNVINQIDISTVQSCN